MLFQHTLIENILSGKKTQTRRLIKGVNLAVDKHGNPGATDSLWFDQTGDYTVVTTENGHLLYQVGKTYAVQPGRGKPGIRYGDLPLTTSIPSGVTDDDPIRIRITAIRCEDVRDISEEDIQAEGFDSDLDFFDTWLGIYDKAFLKQYLYNHDMDHEWDKYGLATRPAERYQAWALTFEVVR